METDAQQEYGTQHSCGQCDDEGLGHYKPHAEPTLWWIGLAADGQAHYLCQDCKDSLHCVRPLFA